MSIVSLFLLISGKVNQKAYAEYSPSSMGSLWNPKKALKQPSKFTKRFSTVRASDFAVENENQFSLRVELDHSQVLGQKSLLAFEVVF